MRTCLPFFSYEKSPPISLSSFETIFYNIYFINSSYHAFSAYFRP